MSRHKEPINKKSSDAAITNPIAQNIDAVSQFYENANREITPSQRQLENISLMIGKPVYLGCIILFVVLWIAANRLSNYLGYGEWDEAPYFWLQGLITFVALITTTIVLIKQNREAKLEEQRAHLELQINLLAEQKTTKIIRLLEELRRDLPGVHNRADPEVEAYQQPTDPNAVLHALEEVLEDTANKSQKTQQPH